MIPINEITIEELKKKHEQANPRSIFFETATLKAFGEYLSQMKVLKKTVIVKDRFGNKHRCYVVSSVRFKTEYVHYYFDTESFRLINPQRY